jgi:hypothetical protein
MSLEHERSVLQHTRNRMIDQRSPMTTIPTDDLCVLWDALNEKIKREEEGDKRK